MDGVVSLDLPGKDDVLLLGGNLERLVVPLPAKEARQDFDKAGVGAHEVVVDQTCSVHAHLHQRYRVEGIGFRVQCIGCCFITRQQQQQRRH